MLVEPSMYKMNRLKLDSKIFKKAQTTKTIQRISCIVGRDKHCYQSHMRSLFSSIFCFIM